MTHAQNYRQILSAEAWIAELKSKHEAEMSDAKNTLAGLRLQYEKAVSGLCSQTILLAEHIIKVRGKYLAGSKDQSAVVSDAQRFFATGEGDLWTKYYGTKNYDRWSNQRSDHEYLMGPKHGNICFSIGLHEEPRSRDPRKLTEGEINACLYYLANIERIQAAQARAAV